MEGAVAALGAVWFVALVILAFLTLMIPVFIYQGQKHARRCVEELQKTNAYLVEINQELGTQRLAWLQSLGAVGEVNPPERSGV